MKKKTKIITVDTASLTSLVSSYGDGELPKSPVDFGEFLKAVKSHKGLSVHDPLYEDDMTLRSVEELEAMGLSVPEPVEAENPWFMDELKDL